MTLPDFSVLGAYVLLLLALLATLFTRRRLALGLGVAASVAGLLTGVLQLPALAAIAVLAGLGAALQRWPRQPALWALAVLLMLVLALHRWPGFVSHAWWQGVLPGASQPYTVYWHWDKGLAGLWLLLCLPAPQWGAAIARPRLWAVAGLALLAALWLALGSGLLVWQPKMAGVVVAVAGGQSVAGIAAGRGVVSPGRVCGAGGAAAVAALPGVGAAVRPGTRRRRWAVGASGGVGRPRLRAGLCRRPLAVLAAAAAHGVQCAASDLAELPALTAQRGEYKRERPTLLPGLAV